MTTEPEKVEAWKAIDGSLHASAVAAKNQTEKVKKEKRRTALIGELRIIFGRQEHIINGRIKGYGHDDRYYTGTDDDGWELRREDREASIQAIADAILVAPEEVARALTKEID